MILSCKVTHIKWLYWITIMKWINGRDLKLQIQAKIISLTINKTAKPIKNRKSYEIDTFLVIYLKRSCRSINFRSKLKLKFRKFTTFDGDHNTKTASITNSRSATETCCLQTVSRNAYFEARSGEWHDQTTAGVYGTPRSRVSRERSSQWVSSVFV